MNTTMPSIPAVTDLQSAFPVADQLPAWPDIDALPADFRNGSHVACDAAARLFYGGIKVFSYYRFLPRYDMTEDECADVLRLVTTHLRCFDYKHEDKMSGCGWLLNQWFQVDPV